MALTVDEILQKSEGIISEQRQDSITPARVGELTYALAELIKQGVGTSGSVALDKHFQQYVPMPSKLWTITHNLNKHPAVTVINNDNQIVEGSVSYIDNNTIQIEFSAEFSGTVYCN